MRFPYAKKISSTAIIIKRYNTGESDRIITLLTKNYGKIKAVAKGVRKITSKRNGYLEIFNCVKVNIHQSQKNNYITEIESVGQLGRFSNLQKISYAYYVCELAEKLLPENEKQDSIFEMTLNALIGLEHADSREDLEKIVVSYAVELLVKLGYLPEINKFSYDSVSAYIESVIERPLRTLKLINNL